jgi:hypothetical protein
MITTASEQFSHLSLPDKTHLLQQLLDQVFAKIKTESWFRKAENYAIEINEVDRPRNARGWVLATTTRGGHLPTKITYYLRNIRTLTYTEIYRITKHEFAHLWGMNEHDAQTVEP